MLNHIINCFIGLSIGDAIGVPFEFKSREELKSNPVTDMVGYKVHNQPIGSFSDDSSMTFCLVESLIHNNQVNENHILNLFIQWAEQDYWAANKSFDIGSQTRYSLLYYKQHNKSISTNKSQWDIGKDGNGALMRISPLIFWLYDEPDISVRYKTIEQVASLTHCSSLSNMCCFFFVEYVINLLKIMSTENYNATTLKFDVFKQTLNTIKNNVQIDIDIFNQLELEHIQELTEDKISSSGYVIHTIQTVFWCFLNSNSYKEAVLKAVNLGEDTDTNGSIVGALAGIYYQDIPEEWINKLLRKDDIVELAYRFNQLLCQQE